MALDMNQMSGLFTNPADLRRSRIDEIMSQQRGLSGLGGSMSGLLGQVAGMGGVTGSMLAEGLAGATGMRTAQEARAEQAQNIMKNLDMNDPDSMMRAAGELNKRGLTKASFQLLSQAQELKQRQEDVKFRQEKFGFEKEQAEATQQFRTDELGFRKESEEATQQFREDELTFRKETEESTQKFREEKFTFEKQQADKDFDLRTDSNELQSRNLDLQAERLEFLMDQDEREADLKAEDRADLEIARTEYADALRMSGDPDQQRIADAVESGAISILEAEKRLFPQSGQTAAGDRDAIRKATAAGRMAEVSANKAINLAVRYNSIDPAGGFFGSVYGTFKNFVGGDDEVSRLKTDAENLINQGIVSSLPPGPASDKDIAIMSKGFPDSNWNATEITEWLQAYARMKKVEAKYNDEYATWLSSRGGDGSGFNEHFKDIMSTPEALLEYEGGSSVDQGTGGEVSFDDAMSQARARSSRQSPSNRRNR
mgnify:CR=1 FL=1